MKKREFGLDLIRAVAVIFVISVHFYLNNGFYYQEMTGMSMWAAGSCRWLFYTCVPLFLLITGYLRANDKPCRKYYCGVFRVIISWLIISLINIAFRIGYYGTEKSVLQWIGDILDYKAANYSWYVEMYIGMFLVIPYINLAFHSLETRKGHLLMVASVCAITFLPSMLNGWVIDGSTWNLVPNYWTYLYPFGYYVIGCYIRKYRPRPASWFCIGLAVILCMFKGVYTYITADGKLFGDGLGGGYSDWLVCIISVLIFLGVYPISDRCLQNGPGRIVTGIVKFIAAVSFDAYLISWVFDVPMYARFNGQIGPGNYLYHYFVVCVPVMIMSFLAAYPVSLISGKLSGLLSRALKRQPKDKGENRSADCQ
ncbi:MAG: acyltransferase family protein [Lachnospiraceae bacterium]|nr:acyltransferase family protein [Lachnospiraceae bacterium]